MRHFTQLLLIGILVFIFIQSTQAQVRPAIQWQKCLGGSNDDRANDLLINGDGTIIVAGQSRSNDGNVTGHHGNADSPDAWLVKLDTAGNIIWQKSMGGTASDIFKTVIATADNAYLCIGYTSSNDGDVTGNHGASDAWVVKVDFNGNIIWSKCFGGTLNDTAVKAIRTPDNHYAVIGTAGSTNGDLASSGNGGWIFKIDLAGNLLWSKGLAASGGLNGFDIALSEDNNLYALVTGIYQYTGGLFPNEVTITKTPGKLFKLDNATGSSTGPIGTIDGDSCFSMCRISNKTVVSVLDETYFYPEYCFVEDLYLKSKPDGSATFNTQQIGSQFTRTCSSPFNDAINIAPSHGLAAAETSAGLVAAGSLITRNAPYHIAGWLTDLNGSNSFTYGYDYAEAFFRSVKVFQDGKDYVVAGYVNGNGGDISGFHGGAWDLWVVKLSGLNRIVGNVFIDANNNNINDPGELPYTHATVKTTSPGFQRTAVAYSGFFDNTVATGTFTSTISLNRPYYTVTPVSKSSTFTSYKNIDSVNFAVHPVPGIIDYSVAAIPLTTPRPGTLQEYRINYYNKGTTALINKEVVFIKDPGLHYASAVPAYTSISGDSIKWNISSLAPDGSGSISLFLQLDAIPLVNLGDTIESAVYIDSTLDVYKTDNYLALRQQVSGSFDPNDKQEIHGGFITPSELASGTWLDYTIRFQNTGNDTAFTITIRDTLSTKLNTDSIEVNGASHNCSFTIKNGQYLTCTFPNIKLVDSLHNEPLSHGYISFRIKPKSTWVTGDSILNSASIYFDYNPPVRTNTQLTVIRTRPVPVNWTGTVSTAWENPLNWSTGTVPDANSNVTIQSAAPNNPVVNSNVICRSLKVSSGATLLVKSGFNITVLH